MKIGTCNLLNLQKYTNFYPKCRRVPVFKRKNDSFDYCGNYIKSVNCTKNPIIEFNKPIPPDAAFLAFIKSNNPDVDKVFMKKAFDKGTLSAYMMDISNFSPEISHLKVKNLYALGCFAIVFETEDGKILKISEENQFDRRKPDDFDAPVEEAGKGNFLHYYIEKKFETAPEKILDGEFLDFCKYIESKGYLLCDVRFPSGGLKKEQFGKDERGKLYLLDPQCAIKI